MSNVQVRAGGDECTRCAAQPYLTATIGEHVAVLCPSCDAHAPQAQKLLEYFAKHQSVSPQDASYVSDLVGQWLASLTEATAKPKSSLAAEAEAWWARYK